MSGVSYHSGLSMGRIGAMILRYWYLLLSSWPRLLELLYWPALQIITWGFLQLYIAENANFFARAGGTLIGAVILWDILFRGQLGFSISFLEEMWARNLANLMISPLPRNKRAKNPHQPGAAEPTTPPAAHAPQSHAPQSHAVGHPLTVEHKPKHGHPQQAEPSQEKKTGGFSNNPFAQLEVK